MEIVLLDCIADSRLIAVWGLKVSGRGAPGPSVQRSVNRVLDGKSSLETLRWACSGDARLLPSSCNPLHNIALARNFCFRSVVGSYVEVICFLSNGVRIWALGSPKQVQTVGQITGII